MNQILTAAKAHVALVGGVLSAIVAMSADSEAGHVAAIILAVLTALGVYQAPKTYTKRTRGQTGATLIEGLVVIALVLGIIWLIFAIFGHPHFH